MVLWLNCFPHKEGIHPTISPLMLVTGLKLDFNKHCKLQFGTFVQMNKKNTTIQSTMSRGNAQGRLLSPQTKPHWEEQSLHYDTSRQQSTHNTVAEPHIHVMMTQMSVREGLKIYGDKGNEVLLQDLNQLHEQKALLPLNREDIAT